MARPIKVIWKYDITPAILGGSLTISVPRGARLRHLGNINSLGEGIGFAGKISALWLEVNPKAEREEKIIEVVGTGESIPDDLPYLGTIIDDPFVWHVFGEIDHA